MYDAALKLGAAVVKAACGLWLGNPLAQSAATTVVDLVQARVAGQRDRRRLERRFAEIEESIADRVVGQLEHEFHGLDDNEREAAVLAVADAFERAGLTDRTLFEQDLDPLHLERYVRERSPGATLDLGGPAVALYDRVLPEACAYVLATASALPRFQAGAFTELLRRESLVLEHLEEVLDRLPRRAEGRAEDPGTAFTTAYLRKAAQRWDVLELFGADVGTRSYPLSLAYLSLRVSREPEHPQPGDRYETGDSGVEQVLAAHPRTFLRGPAGSGKTTLLRWVGVRASRGDFPEEMASWNGLVPFLVPLREYVGRDLPEPAEFVRHTGRHLADQVPPGWVTGLLAGGRAVVLVDGVDELPRGQRESARRWLRDLLADFPSCRYVVTARPGAAGARWLDAEGFAGADLQPLGDRDVRAFVHHWHEAVRSGTADADERALLTRHEHELGRKITGQRHLRAIASTPLLCALLCALYRDRRTVLPRDRMEVYEAALAMLLKDRDQQRGIEGVDLSRRELVLLLQELARWLVVNGSSDAPVETARRQVARSLASMHRVEQAPEEVYTHLVVRSGLLHTPTADRVSFLHRTFEEYLAAKALVEEDSFPLLVRNAHDDQWHEVVVMAAGHATPAQREELIRGLLDRSDRVRAHRDRLLIVAFACLETSPQLSRVLGEEIRERVRGILPPRTRAHVHALSLVGEFALPLLREIPPGNARQAEKVIEAAAAIGGPDTVPVIGRALDLDSERVFLAAQKAWWADQSKELAEVFLSQARSLETDYYLPVPADNIDLLVRHLPDRPRVSLEGQNGDGIGDIVRLPHTTEVELSNRDHNVWHGIDIAPLRGFPGLSRFRVHGNASIRSVAPLTQTSLEQLSLSHPGLTRDLEMLRGLDQLSRLEFYHTLSTVPLREMCPPHVASLAYVNTPIENLSPLIDAPSTFTAVRVWYCSGFRSIDGLESQTESLVQFTYGAREAPNVLDLSELVRFGNLTLLRLDLETASANRQWISRMPGLRYLQLSLRNTPAVVPTWVRDIPGLHTLSLPCSGPLDVRPLAGARGLTVRAHRRTRVIGAGLLGEGSALRRGFPAPVLR
ncbi:NACHT domain-containing protein [Nocardiopsis sp. NPDC101807]|uniref:NACHT domain-containing protein n=1 Tax=Nocardiopsis sp. NPDC101807 TaxID=3364339 RepID=UPI0037FCFE24